MTERGSKIINTVEAAKAAIDLRLSLNEERFIIEKNWDGFGFWEKLFIKLEDFSVVLDTLKPKEIKVWIRAVSSVNYGKSLLDEVFPRIENPDEYHSRNGEVRLDEHPVQVLGWEDYKERKERGVKDHNLDRNWIEFGFNKRAGERGIDLEWHFHYKVPGDAVETESKLLKN